LNTFLQLRSRFNRRSTVIFPGPKAHIPNHEWFTNPLVALLLNNSSTNYRLPTTGRTCHDNWRQHLICKCTVSEQSTTLPVTVDFVFCKCSLG
jgi:hypothetical protein